MSNKDLLKNNSINSEIKLDDTSFKSLPKIDTSPKLLLNRIPSPSIVSPIFSDTSNFFNINVPSPTSRSFVLNKTPSPPPPPPPPIEMNDFKVNKLSDRIRNINFKRLRNGEDSSIRIILKKSYDDIFYYTITDYEYNVRIVLYKKLRIIRINNVVFNIDRFINFNSIKVAGKNMNSVKIDIGKEFFIANCSIDIMMKIYEIIKVRLRI